MLLKIACCDDDKEILKQMKEFVNQLEIQTNEEIQLDCYVSGRVLIEKLEGATDYYDVIFLDMEMPEMNGMEVAKKIRQSASQDVLISFLTSYPDYMHQSFHVQAFQYLLKPLSYRAFKNELIRTINYVKNDNHTIMLVDYETGNEVAVRTKNIMCVEKTKGSAVMELTVETGTMLAKGNLSEYEKTLEKNDFIRVSRNCMVNMRHIHLFRDKEIQLLNGKRVDMSRRKITEVKETFTKYLVLGAE